MKIEKNVPLAPLTTFHIGGKADYFTKASTLEDLIEADKFATKNNIPIYIMGMGSNMLFSDKGFRGLILQISNDKITFHKKHVNVHAGVKVYDFVTQAMEQGYDFTEWCRIPGLIGSAIYGNAGAHGLQIAHVLQQAEIFDIKNHKLLKVQNDWLEFRHRHSNLSKCKHYMVWSADFHLGSKKDQKELTDKINKYNQERRTKQPVGYSAGSFFKNTAEKQAWELLDEAGCRELRVGDAQISKKHANWIINLENAVQKDVIELAKIAVNKVYRHSKIILEPEVILIDEYGKTVEI